jgi:hypothetical protein
VEMMDGENQYKAEGYGLQVTCACTERLVYSGSGYAVICSAKCSVSSLYSCLEVAAVSQQVPGLQPAGPCLTRSMQELRQLSKPRNSCRAAVHASSDVPFCAITSHAGAASRACCRMRARVCCLTSCPRCCSCS